MSSVNPIPVQAAFQPPGEVLPKPATAVPVDRIVAAETSGAISASTPSATQAPVKPGTDQLDKAVTKTNDFLQSLTSLNLQFSVDKDVHRTIVKVVDPSTKEVVRQIPSEEVIEIAKSLDRLQGLLLKDKA